MCSILESFILQKSQTLLIDDIDYCIKAFLLKYIKINLKNFFNTEYVFVLLHLYIYKLCYAFVNM